MANKTIAFEIEVLGHSKTVENIAKVEVALAKTSKAKSDLKKEIKSADKVISQYDDNLKKLTDSYKESNSNLKLYADAQRKVEKRVRDGKMTTTEADSALFKLSKRLKSNIVSEQQYNKAVKALNDSRDKSNLILSKEETQLKKIIAETKVLQNQKKSLNKALNDESKALEKNVGSMSHFRVEVKNLQDELDGHVKGISITNKAYDELYKKVGEGKKKIVDFDQGLNDGRSNVGRYKDSLMNLAGGFGDFGGLISGLGKGAATGAIFGAIATGAVAAAVKVNELVSEFSVFRDKVALLSNATGDELDKIVVQVDKIANTYGKEQDELLEATKNFSLQYGISFLEASELIEGGFQGGADASGKFLDLVKEYPSQFKNAGLSAKDFIDAATANELLGFYNDKGVDAIKEFGLSVTEQSKTTEDAFQKAFGVEYADKFFKDINDGTVSVGSSIEVFVKKIRDSNLPIKEQQTLIADVFKGAGEDAAILSEVGLQYLETVTDMRNGTKELTVEQQAYLDRTNNLADANERLSTAKNELTKLLADESGAFNVLQTEAQAFLIETLNELIVAFSPVIETFKELFSSLGEYYSMLFDTGEATEGVSDEGSIMAEVFDVVAGVLTFVVDVLTNVVDAVLWGIKNIDLLSFAFDLLRNYVQNWMNLLKNLPNILNGVIAGATQMKDNLINAFKDILLQMEILKLEAEKLNPFGKTSENLDKEILKLKAKRVDILRSGKSVGEAFKEGFTGSIDDLETEKAVSKASADAAAKAKEDAAKAEVMEQKAMEKAKLTKAENEKAAKAAEKKAKAAEKEAEKLKKEQEKKAEEKIKAAEKLASELQKIQRKATEEELKNLEDGIIKDKKLKQDRFSNDIEDLKLQLINKESLSKNEILFNESINKIIEQREIEHSSNLSDIDEKYALKSKAETENSYKFKADKLDDELAIQNNFAQLTIVGEEELAEAKKKIALDIANQKLKLIRAELESTGVLNEDQLSQLKKLQSEIQSLQAPVKATGFVNKANDFRQDSGTAINTGIGNLFGTDEEGGQQVKDAAIGLANDVFNGISDAKAAQIQSQLQQDLEYYKSRAEMELQTLDAQKAAGLITEEEYSKGKEDIETRARVQSEKASEIALEKDKKLKKRMAVINAAAAILTVLATTPFPASLFAAAAIGVKAAFEVAAIDKAEKGMYLDTGRLHSEGGELIEIEKGEAVINRKALASKERLNLTGTPLQIADSLNTYKGTGRSFLKGAGIKAVGGRLPTLANGGFSGKLPTSLTPPFVQQQQMNNNNMNKFGEMLSDRITKAINDKKVIVTTKDIIAKTDEVEQVKINSTWL
jgi:hypothetical protein